MHATSSTHIERGSKPCLCSKCVYKRKPESSRDKLLHGSRIDKLYYDKYLPLRERKLVEKLVRTRAVYDDIRNRILESDTDNNENCGCVNKRKVNATESNPIHDIVSLVDRGELSSLNSSINLHSDCCSCCDCKPKVSKPPKVHRHIPSLEVVEEYLVKHKEKKVKSDSWISTLRQSSVKKRQKYEHKHFKQTLKTEKSIKEFKKQDKKEHTKSLKPIICKCVKKFKSKNSIVSIQNAVNEIRESVQSSISTMGNQFRNLKKDSLTLFREKRKKNKNNDPMEDWACAPGFCIPDHCNPADCYKEIKRRLPDLDHKRKIRFADEKVQTNEYDMKTPKVKKVTPKRKRMSKIQKIICDCTKRNVIKSAASMTNMSVAKTTSTNKNSTRTKSASSAEKQKLRKRRGGIAISHKRLPFPRECDPGMCEPGKCNLEDCAKILLKSSQGVHHLDKCYCTLSLKRTEPKAKKPKKQPKPKLQEIIREHDSMKSTASSTNLPVSKPKTKNKSPVATKSTSANKQQQPRVGTSKALPFPRECNPGMCEPGKCDPEKCAEILLRNSPALHKLEVKKRKKKTSTTKEKVAIKVSHTASKVKSVQKDIDRCFCTLDLKKTYGKQSESNSSSSTQTQRLKPVPKPKKIKKQRPIKIDECICKNISSTSTQSQKRKPAPKKTKITSTSVPKATSRNVQSRVPKRRKRSKPVVKPDNEEYSLKSKSAPDTPARQVVRISSSFRFNIEFFKENNYLDTKEITTTNNDSAVTPKAKISTSSEIKTNTKKVKQTKIKIVKQPKKKTKATEPITERNEPLKRCFCTLELHKKEKKKSDLYKIPSSIKTGTEIIHSKTNSTSTSNSSSKAVTSKPLKAKRCFCTKDFFEKQKIKVKEKVSEQKVTFTQTKKKSPVRSESLNLQPYECEPNFCIPGACDPIKCEKRIRNRKKKRNKNEVTQVKHRSLVQKCWCTLKLHVKPKKEKKLDIPAKPRTIETQTVKHKKDDEILVHHKYQSKEPKEPKRQKRKNTSSYTSGLNETQDNSNGVQPFKTKKRNKKYGSGGFGDSLPSSSPSNTSPSDSKTRHAVTLGSELSFSIEFYRNKIQSRKHNGDHKISSNHGVHNRGNTANIGFVHVSRDIYRNSGIKLKVLSREERMYKHDDTNYGETPYRNRKRM